MLKIIKEKNVWRLIFFRILLMILNKRILCNNNNIACFEYSCEECNSPEYGNCTKCRYGWTLIDGTCPCFSPSCAVCTTGFFGSDLCQLCKKGYVWDNNYCICNISNCEHCGEHGCLVCNPGYIYNNTTNECEKIKDEKKIACYDSGCDICFSESKGACIKCKKGYYGREGVCYKLKFSSITGLCPYNYYNKDDFCFPICDEVDCPVKYNSSASLCPSNECLICKNNSLQIWTKCDNSEECSSIEGCLNCITNGECIFCNQGYYLLGGLCYKCIRGCSICYNNNSCEYCFSGFELNPDKKCNLTYNFDFDIIEYNKYKEAFLNKTCPDNKCLSCYVCDTEEYCKYNLIKYGIDEEQCMKCPDKCLNCYYLGSKKYCKECEKGYKNNNEGNCSLICSDKNCLECYLDSNGKEYCNKCKDGYKINEAKCSLCSDLEGCIDCYFENGRLHCTECGNDYFLNDGNCINCIDEEISYC